MDNPNVIFDKIMASNEYKETSAEIAEINSKIIDLGKQLKLANHRLRTILYPVLEACVYERISNNKPCPEYCGNQAVCDDCPWDLGIDPICPSNNKEWSS